MNWSDVVGHISLSNIEVLTKYAKLVSDGGIIADIGTCAGKSALVLATANPKALVYTVDPNPNPTLEFNLKRPEAKNITFFNETSLGFGKNHCPQLEMCFIDGLHEYVGVKDDITNIVSKVVPGGWALFHDHDLYLDSVGKAIDEGVGKFYEFVEKVPDAPTFTPDVKEATIWVGRRI